MQSAISLVLLALVASPCVALDDAKNRPVSKVITLLKDMVSQLEKEAEEDEEVYESMSCWCETNDKAKTKAISDAEAKIGILTAAIEEYAANAARLNTEIANLEKEVAENTDALDKATALRQKELAEFTNEEKESLGTIASLKSAIAALSKHHDAALLQSESTDSQLNFLKAMMDLQHKMNKHANLVAEMITPRQRKAITAFLHQSQGYNPEYAPASGEIFGLLKQMKEGFESNLANSQKEEMTNQADYEGLKKAKTAEIAAGESQIKQKSVELGETEEKHALSVQDLDDTRTTLAADTQYLANLKEQCALFDSEYAERTKTRQLEIQAVSKALAFLSSDEAQDLVSRTFGFIQVRSKQQSKRRNKISTHLAQLAQKFKDPRISTLAVRARLDAFTKVKKSIQDMVDKLVQEKEDEVKHKDFCVEEINSNEKETQLKEQEKGRLEDTISALQAKIDALTKEIAELTAQVGDLQISLKRAGEDRNKENKDFQTTVADQRASQKLLATALEILKGFYDKAALLQKKSGKQEPAGPPPPPGFKTYNKNAQSGGVMGMIEQIINDAKAMEADAIKAEEDAQIAYESLVTETNNSITAAEKAIIHAQKAKGNAETEKAEKGMERDSVMSELEALAGENADLHKACDYTLKNFDLRQTARDEEIEALKQAAAMLSGASFSAFLQRLH